MTRHVLKTDGAWVELRDVEDLRGRDRKAVNAIVMAAIQIDDDGNVIPGSESVSQIVDAAPEAVAAQLISSWEIPYLPDALIPRLEPENLGELKLEDYDRLRELIDPAVTLLMPRSSKDPSDYDDPTSPSGPASV
jgi:PAS domain-containing protein